MKTRIIRNWNEMPQVMGVPQTALLFGVCEESIRRWASAGAIPCQKIGHQWFFNKDEIKKFMEKGVES